MDALAILRQPAAQDAFRRHRLVAAFLFGSRARGQATEASDVDLAILFPRSLDAKGRLEATVSLGRDLRDEIPAPLDIVSLNDVGPPLEFEAVIGGITVYAPVPDDVIRYEILVRHRHEDFLHIHEIWMRGFRERLGVQ